MGSDVGNLKFIDYVTKLWFTLYQNLKLEKQINKTRSKRSWRRRIEIYIAYMVCCLCLATSITAPIFLHVDEEGSWTYNVKSSSVWLWWIVSFEISLWFSRNLGSDVGNSKFIVYVTKLWLEMTTRGVCTTLWLRLLQFLKETFSEPLSFLTRDFLEQQEIQKANMEFFSNFLEKKIDI